jgi:hypothetical protein
MYLSSYLSQLLTNLVNSDVGQERFSCRCTVVDPANNNHRYFRFKLNFNKLNKDRQIYNYTNLHVVQRVIQYKKL